MNVTDGIVEGDQWINISILTLIVGFPMICLIFLCCQNLIRLVRDDQYETIFEEV